MITRLLFIIGIICLALYGFFTVRAYFRQEALETELNEEITKPDVPSRAAAPPRHLEEGDLFGRLEVPRLDFSVMVMEGDQDDTLRLGAGHIPGTQLAIAGHRDTFFRPLRNIKMSDTIRLTTPNGTDEYQVVSTKIVGPKDTWVLDNKSPDTLTLITCYPFYYVGPAPKRFIIEAVKN